LHLSKAQASSREGVWASRLVIDRRKRCRYSASAKVIEKDRL
jgi:hypothetical protein